MYSIITKSIFVFVFIYYFSYSSAATGPNYGKVVVCYLGNWAFYRPGKGSFSIEDVDPSLCTHLVYSFVGLDITHNSIKTLDPYQDLPENYGKDGYARAVKLKVKYPNLKVTVAFGGWDDGSANYSVLAAEPNRRKTLIADAVQFIKKHKFDGLDLHWKYPTERGGKPEDKQNFVLLVKEFKQAFKSDNLVLTAAFGAIKYILEGAYDVAELSKYLDYVHLMCYDYHGSWENKIGINSPLHSTDELNVEFSVNYLLDRGMDPSKLILGIPLHGQTYYLNDKVTSDSKIIGFPAKNIGFKGSFTKQNGFLNYYEICLKLQNPGWKKLWDEESLTPYAVNGEKVISYDNEASIGEKVKFAIQKRLRGIMITSVDNDDFRGDCNGQKFPILHTINEALKVKPTLNKNKYPLITN